MFRDVDVDNSPALVRKQDEHEQDAARESASLAAAQVREAEAAASLARLEAELEAARESRRTLESTLTATRDELHTITREIDRDESTIRAETDRERECQQMSVRLLSESEQARGRVELIREERASRSCALGEIDGELARIEGSLDGLGAEESDVRARAGSLLAEIESRRVEQIEGAARMAEIANTLGHLQKELQRLAAQSARLDAERRESEVEAAGVAAMAQGVAVEGTQASSASAQARAAAADIQATHRQIEEQIRSLTDEIVRGRETQARLDERVRSLEDVDSRLAGIGSGARWLLMREAGTSDEDVKGVVADFLRVGPDAEAAVEGYLGSLLAAVVVPSSDSAAALISDLQASKAGRCLFVPELETHGGRASDPLPAELASEPSVLGPLAHFAATTNGIQGLLARRLGKGVLVRDLSSAIALSRRYPERDFVTQAGEVVARDGTIEGGCGERIEDGLLARRRLLESTRIDRDRAAARIAEQQETRRGLEQQREEASGELARREHARQDAERAAVLSQERAANLAAEKVRADRRIELLALENQEASDTEARLVAAQAERVSLGLHLEGLLGSLDFQKVELERLREEGVAHAERLAEGRQQRAAARERRQHVASELERLNATIVATRCAS